MKFEYPLQWLPQQPRTKRPTRARFGNHSLSSTGNLEWLQTTMRGLLETG